MNTTRYLSLFTSLLLSATLLGCDKEEEETDTGFLLCVEALPPIAVTVTDPDGLAIEGASVEWDGTPCAEAGGGLYNCTAPVGGQNQLTVIATNMRAHSEFVTLPEPACNPAPFAIDVILQPGIAR